MTLNVLLAFIKWYVSGQIVFDLSPIFSGHKARLSACRGWPMRYSYLNTVLGPDL